MNARKRLFAFLFAALSVLLFTACGKWDYSREAVKAANEAQGDTLRVEFKVNQTFTSALRAAVEDNIQPNDVDNAMTMDKSIAKLLTSGYRLDVYALRADTDADQAAAQLADEFVNRLSGCEDEGIISMVKAENGYFYEAVLVYKHDSSGSSRGGGSGSGDEPEEPEKEYPVQWYEDASGEYEAGTLIFRLGAKDVMGDNKLTFDAVKKGLRAEQYKDDSNNSELTNFSFKKVQHLIVKDGSGVTVIPGVEGKNDSDVIAAAASPRSFVNSEALKALDLSGVNDIGFAAFLSTHLGSINLKNNGAVTIGTAAFSSNYFLATVKITSSGDKLKIDDRAFHGAFYFEKCELTLQGTSIYIGEEAFQSIGQENRPVTVTFNGPVEHVGNRAFSGNKGLYPDDVNNNVTIHYDGGADQFKTDAELDDLSTVGLSEKNFAQD